MALFGYFRTAAFAVIGSLLYGCVAVPEEASLPVTRYANGLWLDGDAFVRRDAFVQDGVFVKAKKADASVIVDLNDAFIVPAFAEAHHHTVICDADRTKSFIDAGIVYAGVMNAPVSTRTCEATVNEAAGLEIVNALAGVTARNAHPSQIGLFFLEADQINGEWVHYVDSLDELETVWPRIENTRPDLLKIYLSYSEDFAALRDDPTMAPWYRGLDPSLVPALVAKAHKAGLRVAAHVMSAHDFDVAVNAKVDIIAHMPGFAPGAAFTENDDHPYLKKAAASPEKYEISPESAYRAAAQKTLVVTTVSEPLDAPHRQAVIKKNFARLKAAGVSLLIGSDRGEFNSIDEALYLGENNLMTPREILKSLTRATPQALFPDRRIGRLAPGYEASFVVLNANPLDDIEALRTVRGVVKKGEALRPIEH